MTDQSDVDVAGGGSTPKETPSTKPVEDAETLSRLVEGVVKNVLSEELKPIKGEISGLYSRQDKDRNAFSEFMAEYKKQKAKGLNDEAAEIAANNALDERKKATRRDQLIEAVAKKLGLDSEQPVGNGEQEAVSVAEVVKLAGLDPSDPEVIAAFAGKNITSNLDAAILAGRVAASKASKPQPTEADKASPQTPSPKRDATPADISAKVDRLNLLYKSPTRNAAEIKKLEEEVEPYLPH